MHTQTSTRSLSLSLATMANEEAIAVQKRKYLDLLDDEVSARWLPHTVGPSHTHTHTHRRGHVHSTHVSPSGLCAVTFSLPELSPHSSLPQLCLQNARGDFHDRVAKMIDSGKQRYVHPSRLPPPIPSTLCCSRCRVGARFLTGSRANATAPTTHPTPLNLFIALPCCPATVTPRVHKAHR